MNYVDGFIAAVPNANKDAYIAHVNKNALMFKEYGALSVVDCWGDDAPEGKLTSYTMAVKREADESIVFSWVTWSSKDARNVAWGKIMQDPRMSPQNSVMPPFDGKRLIYGGFQVVSEV